MTCISRIYALTSVFTDLGIRGLRSYTVFPEWQGCARTFFCTVHTWAWDFFHPAGSVLSTYVSQNFGRGGRGINFSGGISGYHCIFIAKSFLQSFGYFLEDLFNETLLKIYGKTHSISAWLDWLYFCRFCIFRLFSIYVCIVYICYKIKNTKFQFSDVINS